ncbi:MAG: hypothetical protein K2X76_15320 [Sphingomonas sp.]|nr:hypothetical protein [Sphingomonas sp.]
METEEERKMQRGVSRSEYISAAALMLNVLTFAFGAGVYVNTIAQHSRDIQELRAGRDSDQKQLQALGNTLARIETTVNLIAERAREDRAKMDEEFYARKPR